MNYTGMCRSNTVQVTDPERALSLLSNGLVNEEKVYDVNCRADIEYNDKAPHLVAYHPSQPFNVQGGHDESVEAVEELLTQLSEFLADDQTFYIRSVGFTGTRHVPDAYQWSVSADGEVTNTALPDRK